VRQLESRLTPSLTTLASFPAPPGENPYGSLIMDGSGNLYGTTYGGGAYGDGMVFELTAAGGTLTTLASFNGTDGANPYAGLIADGSGNLYGTTYGGGASGDGTVFELAHGSGVITTLASFNGTDGANPQAGLILDGSGNVYGTTYGGGASGDGTVFELSQGSGTITPLGSFNGTDGQSPTAGLVMDSGGNLYGTTTGGGADRKGTVFELSQGSGAITTLASFDGTDGSDPYAGLLIDASGNLYGTALQGGAHGKGAVFELSEGSGTISTLASFGGLDGANPYAALITDGSGNLYGTTYGGGASGDGTVFELTQGSGTITRLASFDGSDGTNPQASLIMDGSGNLYATAVHGGAGYGTVSELAQGARKIETLASFVAPDGIGALGTLIMDSSGNLYGTTRQAGAYGDGTVFRLAPGSGKLTALASFNGTDGANPYGGLIMDGSGNLYGTTYGGGAHGDGTVFELAAGSSTITTLASFEGTDGAHPFAALVMDSSGNLYGTTYAGGASNDGTVFELAHGSGAITRLASFTRTDGIGLYAGLVMDGSGNLYGTAVYGGAYGDGTVFELPAGSRTITTLASFNGIDGDGPYGGLIMDKSGNLFGTAVLGGELGGEGTVFELPAGTRTITTLASFNGTDGNGPYAGLLMDKSGNLYGTAAYGGDSRDGTVFELPAGSGTITTLVSFDGTDGTNPQAGLILGSHGNLYGTTVSGGAFGGGTVFELPGVAVPDTWTGANSAVDTNWSDGANWSLGTPPVAGQTVLFTNNSSVVSFTSTVDAGFTSAIGVLHIDSTWGGTITVNSPLSVTGDFTLGSGSFGGSGAVTVGGNTSRWTGGQIDLGSGGLTNTGTLTADTTGGDLVLTGAGTLNNNGSIVEIGKGAVVLGNGATLEDTWRGWYNIEGSGGIAESGGGYLVNAGTLEKSKGGGTATIATTSLDNTGVVEVASGTLDVSAAVTQVTGSALTAGSWTVAGNSTVHSKLDITSAGRLTTLGSGAAVTLSGLNTTFTNLRGLTTIDTGASFSLFDGQSFTTLRALRNKGDLRLGPGSVLTVNGNFTQTLTGALIIELGGTDTAPTFGQLVSTSGTVMLGGSLYVVSTVVPALGSSFEILDNKGNSASGGTFKGLAEGATFTVRVGTTTMTFQITYAGTDDDGSQNVILTRIS
jgi:uncharacterized repeat protein (TIGR03803 family)